MSSYSYTYRFRSNQKKPSSEKNFFQNYSDHLTYLLFDIEEATQIGVDKGIENEVDVLNLIIPGLYQLKHFLMLEQLRDSYDYMDEVIGVLLPFAGALVSLGELALSIKDGAEALAIKLGVKNDDKVDHWDRSCARFIMAAIVAVTSIVYFLKSAISLITRPLRTLFGGWQPQDEKRFYDSDSYESKINNFLFSVFFTPDDDTPTSSNGPALISGG